MLSGENTFSSRGGNRRNRIVSPYLLIHNHSWHPPEKPGRKFGIPRPRRARRFLPHNPCRPANESQHEHEERRARRQDRPLVSPEELAQPVTHRWGLRLHRLVGQVTLNIARKADGRFVSAAAVFLQRL